MPDLTRSQWQSLCPDLSIEGSSVSDPVEFTTSDLTSIADDFWSGGYLKLGPLLAPDEIARLAVAMDQLQDANIPPVYIYLFDQPWLLFERLRLLIAHFLGEEYALLPNLWAWNLRQTGDTGWPPHRDCSTQTVFEIGPDKMLMSLSLWVPLTDVSEQNGCMFVIPKDQEDLIPDPDNLTTDTLAPYAKALPAKAGSVLGWGQDLIHWGGEFTAGGKNPRKSLSFEFQNASFDPLIAPFLDTAHPPSFDERLTLIGQQFEKYKHIAAQ